MLRSEGSQRVADPPPGGSPQLRAAPNVSNMISLLLGLAFLAIETRLQKSVQNLSEDF